VEGGPFGFKNEEGDIKHQAIAVRNFSISTIEGLPDALQVEISFDPFNWQYYIPMSDKYNIFHYDDVMCWPLIKVWSKRAERSIYNGTPFNGKFGLYFPDAEGMRLINLIFAQNKANSPGDDIAALQTFKSGLDSSGPPTSLTSRNYKKVPDPIQIQKLSLRRLA
jgi:hypothetical protein